MRNLCSIRNCVINVIESLGRKCMTKRVFAIIFTFLFLTAHIFRRWKHMQKSFFWKGFLTESKQGEDYGNLSFRMKFIFWVKYPVSYSRYLRVIVWDRIDRLSFGKSREKYTKKSNINISLKSEMSKHTSVLGKACIKLTNL